MKILSLKLVTSLEYQNVFAKRYVSNWSEEVFEFKKVKNTVPWTYVIGDLKGEEMAGPLCEKELQKAIKFKVQKVRV